MPNFQTVAASLAADPPRPIPPGTEPPTLADALVVANYCSWLLDGFAVAAKEGAADPDVTSRIDDAVDLVAEFMRRFVKPVARG
jgi:hypothetical protein